MAGPAPNLTRLPSLENAPEDFEGKVDSWHRIILENALDAVVGMNDQGLIIDWNRQAEVIFGWNKYEAMGRTLADTIIPLEYREAHYRGLKHFLSGDRGPILNRRIEIVALHRSGTLFPVELTVLPVRIEGEVAFYSFVRDISERKRIEQERRLLLENEQKARMEAEASQRRLFAQYAVMSELAQASDLEKVLPRVLEVIGETLRWDLGACWFVDEAAQNLYPVDVWKSPTIYAPEFVEGTLRSKFKPGMGLPGRVWKSCEPAWIRDIAKDPTFLRAPVALKEGLHGGIAFPIAGGGKTILGVIEFFSREFLEPDEEFIRTMVTLAGQIGQFILHSREVASRRQIQDALKDSESQVRLITDALPALISYVDSNERYQFVNGAYERWFGEERSALSGKCLKEVLGEPTYELVRPYVETVLSGQTVKFDSMLPYRKVGSRNVDVTYVPDLAKSGRTKGFFVLVNDITERKKAEQREVFLSEASALLSFSLHYETTLATLVDLIVPRLADWCSIDLVLAPASGLYCLASKHRDPKKEVGFKALFESYLKKENPSAGPLHILKTGKAEFVPEVQESLVSEFWKDDSEMLQLAHSLALKSYICIPFQVRGKNLGALTLVLNESKRSYEKGDFELSLELGRRAVHAIENSILYRELQEAVHARDEFLSIASHELKTPITSLYLNAQILRRRKEKQDPTLYRPSVIDKYVETNIQQIDRLSKLIEDMLDVSRISHGKLPLFREVVNLGLLVQDVLNQFSEQLKAAGCPFSFRAEKDIEGMWDRFRMEQVVANLLTNAMKYGRSQAIEFSVLSNEQSGIIKIRDHGMGIAQENLERIFQRFERATSASEISGLGLGLYISRQIVTAHGGRIWVQSELGNGSTFIVELPLLGGI